MMINLQKFVTRDDLNRILIEGENQKFIFGQQLVALQKISNSIKSIKDVEFKVFSQYGDDGIIQYLVNTLQIETSKFVEFGVENYKESNTRFLLMHNNWSGLVMDSCKENVKSIKSDDIYWKYDVKALNQFITKNNINDILVKNGFSGKLGLLSIDIDGCDYWIWEIIDDVDPSIVVIEYNSIFGHEHSISVPYSDNFNRTRYHFSSLCWGASLRALDDLAQKKGYYFIGCNSAGNNAYFLKAEYKSIISPVTVEDGYVLSKFRESRGRDNELTFISGNDRLEAIKECIVYNFNSCNQTSIKDLFFNNIQ